MNIDRVDFTGKIDQKVSIDMLLRLPMRVTREDVLVALGEIQGVDEVHWET